jgi:AcrR family transcriptional regulator
MSTRRRIQDAALQLFAAKGFFATGIREIADRVGVTTAALYHYMGSKDELLIEIMVSSMTHSPALCRRARNCGRACVRTRRAGACARGLPRSRPASVNGDRR